MKQIGGIITLMIVSALLGACNSGGGGINYGSESSYQPVESTPSAPGNHWTNLVGENNFARIGASRDDNAVSYDPKNHWVFVQQMDYGCRTGYETNLDYESGNNWQYGLAQALFNLDVCFASKMETDGFGKMYAFGEFGIESSPNQMPLLVTFDTNTMAVQYLTIGSGYPINTDFSNLFYYNNSIYALIINKQSNNYVYGLASFSVSTGAYESSISSIYSSPNQFETVGNINEVQNSNAPLIGAVIGNNGNIYFNDYGKISEVPLNNPSAIRQIGNIVPPENLYENMTSIAYYNGHIYVCGRQNGNPLVYGILSLPVTVSSGTLWNQLGYTANIVDNHNNDQIIGYMGCSSIAVNANKIFVTSYYPSTQSVFQYGFVYESDIQ